MDIRKRLHKNAPIDNITFSKSDSVYSACKAMIENHASCVVIADEKSKLVGILTESDVVRKMLGSSTQRSSADVKINEIMTVNPSSVPEKTPFRKSLNIVSGNGDTKIHVHLQQ